MCNLRAGCTAAHLVSDQLTNMSFRDNTIIKIGHSRALAEYFEMRIRRVLSVVNEPRVGSGRVGSGRVGSGRMTRIMSPERSLIHRLGSELFKMRNNCKKNHRIVSFCLLYNGSGRIMNGSRRRPGWDKILFTLLWTLLNGHSNFCQYSSPCRLMF